jgi:pimeloyl-ACP methyl ester carboxylesterase
MSISDGPVPVRDRFLTVDGRRIHYRDWGDASAPPLLLLHGSFQHAHTWDPVARGLADQYRVVAPDWRGHGESDWASEYSADLAIGDLEALVTTLGLAHFPVAGNSIGGRLACVYAAHHPDQVERLVLLQGFVAGQSPPDVSAQINQLLDLPEVFADLDGAAAAFRVVAPYAPDEVLRQFVTHSLKQGAGGRWISRIDPALRARETMAIIAPTTAYVRDLLPRVTCPALLAAGERSFMGESMRATAAMLPRAQVATIPRAQHLALVDNPDGFLELVWPFLLED